MGPLHGGIAANADGGVIGHGEDGVNLGDGLLAGGAAAAGHIGADAGAAAGHPDLGTQAGAAVALAGGLFLGALGAVGVQVASGGEVQIMAAELGGGGVDVAGACFECGIAFFIQFVNTKGGDGDVTTGA
ncbi:hypothetical protein [Xylella fastidiosa]|uniref:hypothetical protein n=1 Tax=Xylella fastidiosa TaxID=2371 RepID=UPI003CCFCA2D